MRQRKWYLYNIQVITSCRSSVGKESACNAGDLGPIPGFNSSIRFPGWEDPWRRKWQSTPVFLPGNFHGQKSLVGYSPWGHNSRTLTKPP